MATHQGKKEKIMGGNIRDFENNLAQTQIVSPVTATSTAGDITSTTVDLLGYDSLALYGMVGITAETWSGSVYLELQVEESDDDSTYTAVANADITNAVTGSAVGTFAKMTVSTTDDVQVYMTEYRGSKRYVQVIVNVTGTQTSGTPVAVLAIKGQAKVLPVS